MEQESPRFNSKFGSQMPVRAKTLNKKIPLSSKRAEADSTEHETNDEENHLKVAFRRIIFWNILSFLSSDGAGKTLKQATPTGNEATNSLKTGRNKRHRSQMPKPISEIFHRGFRHLFWPVLSHL